jgi:predicted nucleotidyltransferase
MVAARIAGILHPWQDAGMPATEFPPDVAALLGRLRDRLAAREDVVGVYVYGSLVTGDYSPAASDIDVVVLVQREPGQVTTRELTELHTALAPPAARPASCTACTSRPAPRPTRNACAPTGSGTG